jgi:hypothetical protein
MRWMVFIPRCLSSGIFHFRQSSFFKAHRSCSSAYSMKIKLDENLPLRLATLLKALGHDVYIAA